MSSKARTIIINSLIWGFVIVASAVIVKGTPEKTRVISVLSLGYAASLSLIVGRKKEWRKIRRSAFRRRCGPRDLILLYLETM